MNFSNITKLKKFLAKFSCWVTFIFLILLALLIRPTHFEPYFELEAFQHLYDLNSSTRQTLASGPGNNSQSPHSQTYRSPQPLDILNVGFARLPFAVRGIHPPGTLPSNMMFPENTPLAGYGQRQGLPALGENDPTFLSAIWFQSTHSPFVFLFMDTLITPRPVADKIMQYCQDSLDMQPHQIYFSSSHTHSGIGAWAEGPVGEMFAGDYNPSIADTWLNLASETIRQAKENASPVNAIFPYQFDAEDCLHNRLHDRVGQTFGLFSGILFQRSFAPSIVLGVFQAHPTTKPSSNRMISNDYPGEWRQVIEESGQYVAAFAGGAMGSQSPNSSPLRHSSNNTSLGTLLGIRTLASISGNLSADPSHSIQAIHVNIPTPPTQVRLSQHFQLSPWFSAHLLNANPSTFFKALRIGSSLFIGLPGDYSAELALDFMSNLHSTPSRFLNPVFTSFNGDYTGYIVPPNYFFYDSYESRVMSFYGNAWADLCQFASSELFTSINP